jgi:hypothetical protein
MIETKLAVPVRTTVAAHRRLRTQRPDIHARVIPDSATRSRPALILIIKLPAIRGFSTPDYQVRG